MIETPRIASVTVCRDERDRLERLLPQLAWVQSRHLVATGARSTELEHLAQTNSTALHYHPLKLGAPFDDARRIAVDACDEDWVLIVDTDEALPDELVEYLVENLPRWHEAGVEGVRLPRLNHFRDSALVSPAFWPDFQLRLLRRSHVQFSSRLHQGIIPVEKVVQVPPQRSLAIIHDNCPSSSEFIAKMNLYSDIEAGQAPAGQPPSRALLRTLRYLAALLIKRRGYKDGETGLHFALMMAMWHYLSDVKGWEMDK